MTRTDALRALVAKWREEAAGLPGLWTTKQKIVCAAELDAALGCETDEGVSTISVDDHVDAVNAASRETLRSWQEALLAVLPVSTHAMDCTTPETFAQAFALAITAAEQRGAARERERIVAIVEQQLTHPHRGDFAYYGPRAAIERILTAITERPE